MISVATYGPGRDQTSAQRIAEIDHVLEVLELDGVQVDLLLDERLELARVQLEEAASGGNHPS